MLDGQTRNKTAMQLRPQRRPAMPFEDMALGKTVLEVSDLIPRMFAKCQTAQTLGARKALGLPIAAALKDELRREVLHDHLVKLRMAFAGQFGLTPQAPPTGWATDANVVATAVFGPAGAPPKTPDDLDAFMQSDHLVGQVLHKIDQCFDPGEAVSGHLPELRRSNGMRVAAVENSVAGRHSLHPVMRHLAETRGRGPLWRVAGRLYDVAACLTDRLPLVVSHNAGSSAVPAAHGTILFSAQTEAGRVTHFTRVTPTDHLLAPDGVLERALASLPAVKERLADLVVDILDPDTPIRLVSEPVVATT
ncbi:MAG: hydrogenase expression/formation protein HupK [Pseudomonadota bacterium]